MVKVGRISRKPHLLIGVLVVGLLIPTAGFARFGRGKGAVASQTSQLRQGTSLEGVSVDASAAVTRVILRTAGSPSFSSYSPQADVFVVDLPRTAKAAALVLPTDLPPFISSVAADEAVELGTPLTRVTFRFTQKVAAQTASSPDGVVVSFTPPEAAGTSEVVPAVAVKAPEPEQAPALTTPTQVVPDIPAVASNPEPAPKVVDETIASSAPATVLRDIAADGTGESLQIRLATNGVTDYSTLKLQNPLRLVVDLKGVTNHAKRSSIQLGDPYVKRVRVGQFKTSPAAVTRVVLDLDEAVDYHVVKTAEGLIISFGGQFAAAAATQPAATQPAPAPEKIAAPATPVQSVFDEPPAVKTVSVKPSPARKSTERQVIRASAQEPTPTVRPRPANEDVFTPGTTSTPALSGTLSRPGSSRTLTTGDRVYTGEPIDLSLKDADIKDVLRTFGQLTGLNIAIDPQVSGTVTVQFENVPWDQALEIILRQNGLAYSLNGNVMRVGTIDRLAQEQTQTRKLEEEERLNVPTQTVIKHLSYAKASDIQGLLKDVSSARGRIIVDQRTNQLVITEVPQYLQTMLNLIDTVDIPTPQVVIEARIVETTKTFLQQFGITWGFNATMDPALGTGTGLVFPNTVGVVGGPFSLGKGNPLLHVTMANVLGTFDLDVLLTAAESEGFARIVSAPKVTTQDNMSAEIQSGVQIPVQTRVNFTTTVAYTDATLRLQVTPQITAQDTVIMDVAVQKTEPATGLQIAGGAGTPLTTRRAQTRVMVRDGGTTVIGGIYQATENRGQDRIPYLHQIPVLGNLFKARSFDSRHDELLIFITPRIVRSV